jgi:hypothetical protein
MDFPFAMARKRPIDIHFVYLQCVFCELMAQDRIRDAAKKITKVVLSVFQNCCPILINRSANTI